MVVKPVAALAIRHDPASPAEIRIERCIVLIDIVVVTAGGIALPDFHQRVGQRVAIFIQHLARDDDALAQCSPFICFVRSS